LFLSLSLSLGWPAPIYLSPWRAKPLARNLAEQIFEKEHEGLPLS
jgi:hypothetical protein